MSLFPKAWRIHTRKQLSAYGPTIVVVLVFGGFGTALLLNSRAATPTASVQPENGTVTSAATVVSDTSASGGNAVKFNTSTGVPLTTCNNPIFTSANQQGRWPSTGNPYVNNNVWNTTEAGPQTINVCSSGSWYVIANHVDLASNRGSIKAYPSVCQCNLSKPLNQYSTITGTFGQSIPAMGEWNATYDLFMSSGIEFMLDTETHNHPPQTGQAVTIDGVAYHAYRGSSTFLVLAMDNFKKSGTVNFIPIFQWLESQGWMQPTDAINLFGYGVEISYTESSPGVQGPERFDITNWTLTTN